MKLGPYELLEEIGRGGMGTVHRARSPDGREVALKVVTEPGDPAHLAAFERESRLLWSFSEADGFVPVLDVLSEPGKRGLVMPLLGETLRARFKKGPLPVAEGVSLVARIAAAVGRAHERGVVHRDLKPENVLFTARGEPLVADLGLAKHFRRDVLGASQSRSLTDPGTIVGTLGYMAPEQLESGPVRPQADVFALGVLLHEALTGKLPFEAQGVLAYARALRESKPEPLRNLRPDAPRWLEALVAAALAHEASARPADGRELARALLAGGAGPRRVGLLAGGAAALAVLGVALVLLGRGAAAPAPPVTLSHPAPMPPLPVALTPGEEAELAAEERLGNEVMKTDPMVAVQHFNRAIELAPRNARLHALKAGTLNQLGPPAYDEAAACATRAIELDPRNFEALAARAYATLSKDSDRALRDAESAVELAPEDDWVVLVLGIVLEGRNDERALGVLDKAVALARRPAMARLHRASVLLRKGHADRAVADLDAAIASDPRWFALWRARAIARDASGDSRGAIADAEKFLSLQPGDSEMISLLEKHGAR